MCDPVASISKGLDWCCLVGPAGCYEYMMSLSVYFTSRCLDADSSLQPQEEPDTTCSILMCIQMSGAHYSSFLTCFLYSETMAPPCILKSLTICGICVFVYVYVGDSVCDPSNPESEGSMAGHKDLPVPLFPCDSSADARDLLKLCTSLTLNQTHLVDPSLFLSQMSFLLLIFNQFMARENHSSPQILVPSGDEWEKSVYLKQKSA